MTLGLKRSMPCMDLCSLSAGGGGFSETLALLEEEGEELHRVFSSLFADAEFPPGACGKRARLCSPAARSRRPATAAVEAALLRQQQENDENLLMSSFATPPPRKASIPLIAGTTSIAPIRSSFEWSIHEEERSSKLLPTKARPSTKCGDEAAAATEKVAWKLARMTT